MMIIKYNLVYFYDREFVFTFLYLCKIKNHKILN